VDVYCGLDRPGGFIFRRRLGFLGFEFFFVPGVVAEGGIPDAARVDYYLLRAGLELCAAEVAGGGLQRIEEEGGGFVVHLIRQEEAHALHECDLDRVRVFEDRQIQGVPRAAGAIGVELDASLLPALVEVT
jgi:hypothetical protein